MQTIKKRWIIGIAAGLTVIVTGSVALLARFAPGIFNRSSSGEGVTTPVPIPISSGGGGTMIETSRSTGLQVEAGTFAIRLSEGSPEYRPPEAVPLLAGDPLSPEELEALLSRLPELPPQPGDQVEFKLAQDPIPPPRPGVTVEEPFPAPEPVAPPDQGEPGPLKVHRYSPEGEVPVAPFLSITFNQPMVPLGTLADLAALPIPAVISPDLPGTWRWLGTKTLTFEYESDLIDRLPKATEYRVTIPAGTQSQTGGVLEQEVSWTFTTPAPTVVTTYPYSSPQPLTPVFFIAFDQRINPAAVLETIRVTAAGQPVSLVLASQADLDQDQQAGQLAKNALEGRWLAFKAAQPLPADSYIEVTIGPGVPSAEGPLTSPKMQSYSFNTYAPLRIEDHGCSWYIERCQPLTPLYIRFNNPIDPVAYKPEMLTVEPEIPGVSINVYGNTVDIHGMTQGQTTYTVYVSGSIQDIFGQTLGKDASLAFKIGPAEPQLYGPGSNFVTMDPAATRKAFSVYTINYTRIAVEIYAVRPEDYPAFKEYLRNWNNNNSEARIPGTQRFNDTLAVEAPADKLTQVDIDLGKYMDGKYGHFVVKVSPPKGMFESQDEMWKRYNQTILAWVQITNIGLDAFSDHSDMVAWATDLKTGAPLAGVEIYPNNGRSKLLTGEDGIVRFSIPSGATALVAKKGTDQALLLHSGDYWWDYPWNAYPVQDSLQWYVFDDRAMYRPGEEVHIKGWIRQVGGKQKGDVSLVGSKLDSVYYTITDPQGNAIGSGTAKVNALGGFDFAYTIPAATNLGYAQVTLTAQGSLGDLQNTAYYHSFQVQEFRRPEFEVTARNETTGPYFAGGYGVVAVQAKYYAGDALPNADVTWQVNTSPGSYSPPGWPDFTFGTWHPWWGWGWGEWDSPAGDETRYETFSGKTDASGEHYLRLDFEGDTNKKPVSVVANATVMDVNRQAWSSTTTLLVHPASLYVGLKGDRYFVQRGVPIQVELIVTDIDGKAVAGQPVEVQAARLEWKYQEGSWQEVEADVQVCSQVSANEPVRCTFETPIGGTYRITALVTDSQGRQNQSQLTRWVSGGEQPKNRKIEQEKVILVPDRESYLPGETAEILVQSPFGPAEGLLTVSRSGILYTKRFTMQDSATILQVPISEEHIPNLEIQVDLVGSAPRVNDRGEVLANVPARPAFATATLSLSIPPLQRTLTLEVTPDDDVLPPGGESALSVVLVDAAGQPVSGAELAVVVVDEAILALTGYQSIDPISIFYTNRPSYLESVYARASIILVDPASLSASGPTGGVPVQATAQVQKMVMEEALMAAAPEMAADMASGAREAEAPTPIAVRSDFNPLALFAPAVQTDANGMARIPFSVPDNLTRYRVIVVAVDASGKRFGLGENSLTARLPLMIRPSAPRFLNFGDQFELPVVVQNQTGEPLAVDVAVQVSNLELTGPQGVRVTVPAHDRVEVRFPATTQLAGTARIQVAAASGDYADAAVIELPVYTPATTEAFATYGVVDQGAVAQPVQYPTGVFPQYGGLEVTTSSTALQALTDAVLYLVTYPYECSEQLASRILAIAALRDVLTAFQAEGLPSPEAMQASVKDDLARLQGMQNSDGGFPYWQRGFESSPFNTIHVAHALARASQKGYSVPADMQQRALDYLRNIENYYPYWYDQNTRWTLSAYALYVRDLSGESDPGKAVKLINEAGLEKLSMEAVGWLWSVLQGTNNQAQLDAIRTLVANRVVETPAAANFTTYYNEQTYLLLSSDRRTDAILLDALMGDQPDSDLIPKVVNGLLAHRTKGRWNNTQENVFVLLALDRYFNTYEAQAPDFVARLWLGDMYAGSSTFQGYSAEQHETKIPMTYVLAETEKTGMQNLILSKEGTGRLYYRLGLRYAPTDLNLPPVDMGFVVQRRYEAVDDPGDVIQQEDGTWVIKAGARVKVVLTLVATNRRYHVALADPLPAGLEIINPALAVSQVPPQDTSQPRPMFYWWWSWNWYEHQNLRDERAEAFTTLLWDGVYEYSYYARATTPGTFIVPPAKAEEMYSPEVFGRTSSDWVIVK